MDPPGLEWAPKQPLKQLEGLQEHWVQGLDELQLRELVELRVWVPEQLEAVQLLWEWLHAVSQVWL